MKFYVSVRLYVLLSKNLIEIFVCIHVGSVIILAQPKNTKIVKLLGPG